MLWRAQRRRESPHEVAGSFPGGRGEAGGSFLQRPLLLSLKPPESYSVTSDDSEAEPDDDAAPDADRRLLNKDSALPMVAQLQADVGRVYDAQGRGVVYVVGRTTVYARPGSSWMRRFLLEGVYNFLVNNCRGWALAQKIPRLQLIEVGMVSEI